MVKNSKRKASQRDLIAQSRHVNPLTSLREASSSLVKSSYALRCTLDPRTYIPLQGSQLAGLFYAVFVLPGRPDSSYTPLSLLQHLIDDAPLALSYCCAGLAVVQTHVGLQLAHYDNQSRHIKVAVEAASLDESGDAVNTTIQTTSDGLIWQRLADAGIGSLAWSALLAILIIALGAPVTRKITETALLAVFLALLLFIPTLIVKGNPFRLSVPKSQDNAIQDAWTNLYLKQIIASDIDLVLICGVYGGLMGAVVGAVPIPLDWEQPWQTWPVTVIVGTTGGWILGQVTSFGVCCLLWLGRRNSRLRLARADNVASSEVKEE